MSYDIQFFFSIFYTIILISCSLAYKICQTDNHGKVGFGEYCILNDQCVTEYCRSQRCACQFDMIYDPVSGYCVKGNGTISNRQGDCGYLVSNNNILPGSFYTWTIVDVNTNYCSNNYVEVAENSSRILGKLCNKQDNVPKLYASLSNVLIINYRETFDTFRGFRAIYYVRGYSVELKETSGYLASPGYPISYNDNILFTWLISGEAGKKNTCDVELNYDYVKVYNGRYTTSSLIRNYTGAMNSSEFLVSSTNYLLIRFTTDGSASRRGFNASYDIGGAYGNSCNSTEKCIQGFNCYGGTCTCSIIQYYDGVSGTCQNKLLHGSRCVATSDKCLAPLICRTDILSTNRCLCPMAYYWANGSCFSDTELRAKLTSDSIVRAYSAQLKWTTSARVSSVAYNVTWSDNIGINANYVTTNTKEISIKGLTPYRLYYINITTILFPDVFYPLKYVQSSNTYTTKRKYGDHCFLDSQCDERMTCNNTCVCQSFLYYDIYTLSCLAVQSYGESCVTYIQGMCSFPDLVCKSDARGLNKCLCKDNFYYNNLKCTNNLVETVHLSINHVIFSMVHVSGIKSFNISWTATNYINQTGSLFSTDRKIEILELTAGQEYNFTIGTVLSDDSMYESFKSIQEQMTLKTVDVRNNLSRSDADEGHDSPVIWLIAVAAVGWTVALMTVAAIIYLCVRNARNIHKTKLEFNSRGQEHPPDTIHQDTSQDFNSVCAETNNVSHSANRPKNEYNRFPTASMNISEPTVEYVNQNDINESQDSPYVNFKESGSFGQDNDGYEQIEINSTSRF